MYLKLGNTSLRELEDFHYFREGFYYLYFCPRCCRNFETPAAVENCKFCNKAVRLLQHKEKKMAVKYNYLCEKCGKIEIEKRVVNCPNCKTVLSPMYRWDELNLIDRMVVWFSKRSIKREMLVDTGREKTKRFEFKLPSFSINSSFFQRRDEEEMPTSSFSSSR